jgi:hypothetical protein
MCQRGPKYIKITRTLVTESGKPTVSTRRPVEASGICIFIYHHPHINFINGDKISNKRGIQIAPGNILLDLTF